MVLIDNPYEIRLYKTKAQSMHGNVFIGEKFKAEIVKIHNLVLISKINRII